MTGSICQACALSLTVISKSWSISEVLSSAGLGSQLAKRKPIPGLQPDSIYDSQSSSSSSPRGCCGGGRGGIVSDMRAKAPPGALGASALPAAAGPLPEMPGGGKAGE